MGKENINYLIERTCASEFSSPWPFHTIFSIRTATKAGSASIQQCRKIFSDVAHCRQNHQFPEREWSAQFSGAFYCSDSESELEQTECCFRQQGELQCQEILREGRTEADLLPPTEAEEGAVPFREDETYSANLQKFSRSSARQQQRCAPQLGPVCKGGNRPPPRISNPPSTATRRT